MSPRLAPFPCPDAPVVGLRKLRYSFSAPFPSAVESVTVRWMPFCPIRLVATPGYKSGRDEGQLVSTPELHSTDVCVSTLVVRMLLSFNLRLQ